MPLCNPTDLRDRLGKGQRLLGMDVGSKTIGLALSDPSLVVASPLETLRRGKRFRDDADLLEAVVARHTVGGFVVGLPVNMDGSEGPRAQSARQFARNLLERIDLGTVLWDERLSTVAVTRTLLEADLSRARRAEVVDKMAAAYILQGCLDRIARLP